MVKVRDRKTRPKWGGQRGVVAAGRLAGDRRSLVQLPLVEYFAQRGKVALGGVILQNLQHLVGTPISVQFIAATAVAVLIGLVADNRPGGVADHKPQRAAVAQQLIGRNRLCAIAITDNGGDIPVAIIIGANPIAGKDRIGILIADGGNTKPFAQLAGGVVLQEVGFQLAADVIVPQQERAIAFRRDAAAVAAEVIIHKGDDCGSTLSELGGTLTSRQPHQPVRSLEPGTAVFDERRGVLVGVGGAIVGTGDEVIF